MRQSIAYFPKICALQFNYWKFRPNLWKLSWYVGNRWWLSIARRREKFQQHVVIATWLNPNDLTTTSLVGARGKSSRMIPKGHFWAGESRGLPGIFWRSGSLLEFWCWGEKGDRQELSMCVCSDSLTNHRYQSASWKEGILKCGKHTAYSIPNKTFGEKG